MHSGNPLWSAFAAYDFLRSPNISDGFRSSAGCPTHSRSLRMSGPPRTSEMVSPIP